jgi:hypothetical protein
MQIISPEQLAKILTDGENDHVDFKEKQYALNSEKEQARAELLKDILAFANTPRREDAFILIGVEELPSRTGRVVGVEEHLKEADIQQFVSSKTNRPIRFRYGTVAYDEKPLDVIRISHDQRRPLYLRAEFGRLKANAVYVRHGSATGEMTPDEIASMNRPPLQATQFAGAHKDVTLMAERWLSVFDNHGIKRTQIGKLLERQSLSAHQFSTVETTLTVLSDELLDDACRLFYVDRGWLEGDRVKPYQPLDLDNRRGGLLAAMQGMKRRDCAPELLGFRSGKKGLEEQPNQQVGFMLRVGWLELHNREVAAYFPIWPSFPEWSNEKYRWRAKRILLMARTLGFQFFGYQLRSTEIEALTEGSTFPEPILSKSNHHAWHPDDFIYAPEESPQAKESDDLRAFYDSHRKTPFMTLLQELRRHGTEATPDPSE